jgi:hypothetical protein
VRRILRAGIVRGWDPQLPVLRARGPAGAGGEGGREEAGLALPGAGPADRAETVLVWGGSLTQQGLAYRLTPETSDCTSAPAEVAFGTAERPVRDIRRSGACHRSHASLVLACRTG